MNGAGRDWVRTFIDLAIEECERRYMGSEEYYKMRGGKRCAVIDCYKARKIRALDDYVRGDVLDELARLIAERIDPARLQADAEAFADRIGAKDKTRRDNAQPKKSR